MIWQCIYYSVAFDETIALDFEASACSKINYKFLLIVCLWWVVFSILYLAI